MVDDARIKRNSNQRPTTAANDVHDAIHTERNDAWVAHDPRIDVHSFIHRSRWFFRLLTTSPAAGVLVVAFNDKVTEGRVAVGLDNAGGG